MTTNAGSNAALAQAQRLLQTGDYPGAMTALRAAVAREPLNFMALFMLGTLESHFARYDEAERHLSQALALDPRSPEVLASYGNVLLELKRPDRKSTRLNSSHVSEFRMPSSA